MTRSRSRGFCALSLLFALLTSGCRGPEVGAASVAAQAARAPVVDQRRRSRRLSEAGVKARAALISEARAAGYVEGELWLITTMVLTARHREAAWEQALQLIASLELPSLVPSVLEVLKAARSGSGTVALSGSGGGSTPRLRSLKLLLELDRGELRQRCVSMLARLTRLSQEPVARARLKPRSLDALLRATLARELRSKPDADVLDDLLVLLEDLPPGDRRELVERAFTQAYEAGAVAPLARALALLRRHPSAASKLLMIRAFRGLDKGAATLRGRLLVALFELGGGAELLDLAELAGQPGEAPELRLVAVELIGSERVRRSKFGERGLEVLGRILVAPGALALRVRAAELMARYPPPAAPQALRLCLPKLRGRGAELVALRARVEELLSLALRE